MLLYRNAQKLLALEEQLVEEVSAAAEGALTGRLEIGASTGPGGSVLPPLLCEFQAANPGTTIGLSVFDTQTVIDLVGRRELELGVVGAARRQRSVVFEPFFRDEVVLAVPPAHPFAGRTVSLDELRSEPLIVMQEGAGVRQVIEDELRAAGTRLRDLEPICDAHGKTILRLCQLLLSQILPGLGDTRLIGGRLDVQIGRTNLVFDAVPQIRCFGLSLFEEGIGLQDLLNKRNTRDQVDEVLDDPRDTQPPGLVLVVGDHGRPRIEGEEQLG